MPLPGINYRLLSFLIAALILLPAAARAQGALVNGGNHGGSISNPAEIDEWTFDAAQGDYITLAIGEVGADEPLFWPWIWLIGPDGKVLKESAHALAAQIHHVAPLSGTYLVRVASFDTWHVGVGDYLLTLARTPGDFVVPAGDEGGPMKNGDNHPGRIHLGDLDQWTFEAAKGDYITLAIGEVGADKPLFWPWIWLIGPDGKFLRDAAHALAAQIHQVAPLSGRYTVVVSSFDTWHEATGDYQLTLARTPGDFVVPTGDEGGPMKNGDNHPGRIHLGDLDQWTFEAAKGDYITLAIGEVGADKPLFWPWIWLIGPDGKFLRDAAHALAAQIHQVAPLSGRYTVVVSSFDTWHEATGDYQLTLARTPGDFVVPTGDEGGPMTNGADHPGRIHLGDLDQWTFHAVQGASVSLGISEVGTDKPLFWPWIWLIGPDGKFLRDSAHSLAAQIHHTVPQTGKYTVVVSSFDTWHEGTGDYRLMVLGAVDLRTVTPSAGPNGTISPAVSQTVPSGATLNFNVVPSPGYAINGVGGTCGGMLAGTLFTTAPVTADCTVVASFVVVTETLSQDCVNQFGLTATDVYGDADGDGLTNKEECTANPRTHPNGRFVPYLAEGATGSFFNTSVALLNPNDVPARVLLRFQRSDGATVPYFVVLPPRSRRSVNPALFGGLEQAEFSTVLESDVQVVIDRTMTWGNGYGSHAETGVGKKGTRWYLAEGATHSGFQLFYLLQNPNTSWATVQVEYLLPTPRPPVIKTYLVPPASRSTVWVNTEPELADTDVSATLTSNLEIIVERAMYLDRPGRPFAAGHESAAVAAPETSWFLAEGATGDFFDLFVLMANPNDAAAEIAAAFLLPDGEVIERSYVVAGKSRKNIWVDLEGGRLANTAVSTTITSTNGVPVLVERAMWWPGPTAATWTEAHNSFGATSPGARWALAEGEAGGPASTDTFILVANVSPSDAQVRVTLLFEDGGEVTRLFPVVAQSRFNVWVAVEFPTSAGRRFGAIVESVGPSPAQLVVERAMYANAGNEVWAAGSNALATKLQ